MKSNLFSCLGTRSLFSRAFLAVCFCIFAAAGEALADFTASDSAILEQILHNLNQSQAWNASQGYPALTYNELDDLSTWLKTYLARFQDGSNTTKSQWRVDVMNLPQAMAVTNQVAVLLGDPRVSVTNKVNVNYDDTWLKYFLTGRQDGDNNAAPMFRYTGRSAINSAGTDSAQSLQYFLSSTLGQFWYVGGDTGFDSSFKPLSNQGSTTYLNPNYGFFSIWLAEGIRRVLATNEATRAAAADIAKRLALADQLAPTTASNALDQAASETESSLESAEDSLDEIADPTLGDDYTPVLSDDSDVSDSDLGFDDVSDPGDHNALIVLHRASRSGASGSFDLPDIEVDWGRDSALVNGADSFGSWAQWLYGVLFSFLLSVKALHMWRVVRTASLPASVGVNPTISLAWNPF